MATMIGTCHFQHEAAALTYYMEQQSINLTDAYKVVAQKVADGEIRYGKPEVKAGEKVLLNKQEGRYFIELG